MKNIINLILFTLLISVSSCDTNTAVWQINMDNGDTIYAWGPEKVNDIPLKINDVVKVKYGMTYRGTRKDAFEETIVDNSRSIQDSLIIGRYETDYDSARVFIRYGTIIKKVKGQKAQTCLGFSNIDLSSNKHIIYEHKL